MKLAYVRTGMAACTVTLGRVKWRALLIGVLSLTLQACGGGGGGGSSSDAAGASATMQAPHISGYVVMAPVAQSTVELYQVQANGEKLLLESVRTDATGAYAFTARPGVDAVFLVVAHGGQYADEVTGKSVSMDTPLRAVGVWRGAATQVSLSPFSEVAVRMIERDASPSWTSSVVLAKNAVVADWVGVTALLQFKPVDLVRDTELTGSSDDDVNMSWIIGGVSGMAQRLPLPQGLSRMENTLNKLYELVASDRYQDTGMPAFLLGLVDFTELSSFPSAEKQSLERSLLSGGATSGLTLTNQQMMPTGVSSGGALAPMSDDQFLLVRSSWDSQSTGGSDTPSGSLFNERGALVAYQVPGGSDYRVLYSASVAEVYGDGEVGFGRWHGGLAGRSARVGASMSTFSQPELISGLGESYAVAKPPSQLPLCGLRVLNVVASMQPFVSGADMGTPPGFIGLHPMSAVAVQYVGGVPYLGMDLGFLNGDGSVQRLTTAGGVNAPWASGVKVEPNGRFRLSNPSAPSVVINGVLAGVGGHKLIMRVQLVSPTHPLTEQVLVFNVPDGAAMDISGCATGPGLPGPGLGQPLPNSGDGYVLAAATESPFWGYVDRWGYYSMTFGATGQWLSAMLPSGSTGRSWSLPAASPVYEVAGNAGASIGRAGGDLVEGDASRAYVPYIVAKPSVPLPVLGAKRYQLVASTGVVSPLSNASGTALALGTVTAASVDINFDQTVPPGAPPPTLLQAVVRININGMLAGLPFVVANPVDSGTGQPLLLTMLRQPKGGVISDYGVTGVISGANSEYVALVFRTNVAGVTASAAMLLKAQP